MPTTKTIHFLIPQKESENEVCHVVQGGKRVKLSDEGKRAILEAGRARKVIWWHPGGTAFRNMDFAIRFDRVRPVFENSYGVRFSSAPTFDNKQVDAEDVPEHLEFKQDYIEFFLNVSAAQYDELAKYWQ